MCKVLLARRQWIMCTLQIGDSKWVIGIRPSFLYSNISSFLWRTFGLSGIAKPLFTGRTCPVCGQRKFSCSLWSTKQLVPIPFVCCDISWKFLSIVELSQVCVIVVILRKILIQNQWLLFRLFPFLGRNHFFKSDFDYFQAFLNFICHKLYNSVITLKI